MLVPQFPLFRREESVHGSGLLADRSRSVRIAAVILVVLASTAAPGLPGGVLAAQERLPEGGVPVTSEAVIENCSVCHGGDASGRMSRISFVRKTPEGWQMSLRRMMDLYGVQVDTATARRIVRYLADNHGIAPEELRPGLFEVERVRTDYEYPDEEVRQTCAACHSMGRVITQRRTDEEWELLAETHEGLYPFVHTQTFEDARDEDGLYAVDRVNEHLAERYPLETAEWSEWSANVRPPRLEGVWSLSGVEDGHGAIYGTMEVSAVPDRPGEFTHQVTYVRAASGETVSRSGSAVVFTGYQWRGRSGEGEGARREVLFVERGWREMHGRFFTGSYDEVGTEVELRRVGQEALIAGIYPRGLRSGVAGQEVRMFGANLPSELDPEDVDFGVGLRVATVTASTADEVRLEVDVAGSANPGVRDVYIAGVAGPAEVAVFDRIHSVRVEPGTGMARVGGVNFPKELEYFRAIGYDNGPDGETGTEDDVRVGAVPVAWSLAEYPMTYEDDDTAYVGTIEPDGRFVPAIDGPNPERRGNANNVGEVWVVATHVPEGGGAEAEPLRGRGYLLVTVPLYVRFEPWVLDDRWQFADEEASR